MALARGVHLCGSVKLPSDADNATPEKLLRGISLSLPGRLLRMPDGEPGKRQTFAGWQLAVFAKTPWILSEMACQMSGIKSADHPPGDADNIELASVQYDEYAIQSFENFAKIKSEGGISHATRFQVCLPSPISVVTAFVKHEYKERAEQLYEKALIESLAKIQASIPHAELAIQWDCPSDVLFLEGMTSPFQPHFDVNLDAIVSRLARVTAAISEDVQVGFHLCYGDFQHRHFLEPKDTGVMVQLSNALNAKVQRSINWIHMPVPIERKDAAYFEPLKDLKSLPKLDLYLGLVHAHDLEGTKKRIEVAQRTVPDLRFGVATECGLGRTPNEDVASVFDILNAVSAPIT